MLRWLLVGAVSLSCVGAWSQSTTGAISGMVSDQQGRAIPNARLTAVSTTTGSTRTAVSDDAGSYQFPDLVPGTYSVRISAPNFKAWQAGSVTVEIGRVTRLESQLEVGGPQETVMVSNETPGLDTSSAAITTNFANTSIESLPSNSRRWSNFALQSEAVTPDQNGYGLISFRGISVLLNNSTIDGVDNNQAFFSEERGRTRIGYSTTQAAVQEFQVNASNYSAEYGRAAGGVVNTVTRSGGNDLHGQAFFYDRDSAWGATNPFTTLTQRQPDGTYLTEPFHPEDWRKQWGLGAGGPIRRDKLFWFFAYDQYRRNFPGIARTADASSAAELKLFAAPSFQDVELLAARMSTTPAVALQKYNAVLAGLNTLLGQVPRTADQYILFPKLDWELNERNHLIFQYNRMRWDSPNGVQTQASSNYGIASFGNDYVKEDWGIIRWNYFVTANVLNEIRVQYGRDFESEYADAPTPFEQPFASNQFGLAPQISLASSSYGFTFGKPSFLNRPAYPDERRTQFVDTVSWVHRKHTLKTGIDYSFVTDHSNNLYNGTGTYSYANVLNFVSDYYAPSSCDAGAAAVGTLPCYAYQEQTLGPTTFTFNTGDYAVFMEDTWKALPRLTLSFGVREEYQQIPATNQTLLNADVPQTRALPNNFLNLAPRVGLAWDVFGQGHTIFRAGYGIYYGRLINSTIFAALTETGSTNAQRSFYFRPVDQGAPPFPHVFTAEPPFSDFPNAVYFDSHARNPAVQEMEVSVGQELAARTDLTFSFLGSLGRRLTNFVDRNIDLSSIQTITYEVDDSSGSGPLKHTYSTSFFTQRLNPNYGPFTDIFTATNSTYEAGVARITHTMSRSFDLHASYTYAHAWDFNQNSSTFADNNDILDPTDFALENGRSSLDVRQRVAGSAILRTPWKLRGVRGYLFDGYSIAPVIEARNGLPYTMRTSGAVPSIKYVDSVDRIQTLSGLGASINGSGGDNRIQQIGRNTFTYPPVYNLDMRASKRTKLTETVGLELMGEVFNLINHQNVTNIDTTGYLIDSANSPTSLPRLTWQKTFGTVTNSNSSNLYRERQVQLGMRLTF